MPPLRYHQGQVEIQAEAKTTHVAEMLARWVGPVAEFAQGADLFLLAMATPAGTLAFTVLSGAAPLVEIQRDSGLRLRHQVDGPDADSELRIRFKTDLGLPVTNPTLCGGLVINLAQARRARINGHLLPQEGVNELVSTETFTLCRKYVAPSLPLDNTPHLGPTAREALPLEDPWLVNLVAQAETAFLATVSPEGGPDVAHRGGSTGFLELNPANRQLKWSEYVGDGVFKSAGNIRATGTVTLLLPDLDTGDGLELVGRATYRNLRTGRKQRLDALEQHREAQPVQGVMTLEINQALRLRDLMRPRRRLEKTTITSRSTVDEQAPQ